MAYDREKGDEPSTGEAAYRVIRDRESWNADAKVCWGIRKTAPEEALARCSTGFPSQTRDGFIDEAWRKVQGSTCSSCFASQA